MISIGGGVVYRLNRRAANAYILLAIGLAYVAACGSGRRNSYRIIAIVRTGHRSEPIINFSLFHTPNQLDIPGWIGYDSRVVLSGELAVPCTRNPLQRG